MDMIIHHLYFTVSLPALIVASLLFYLRNRSLSALILSGGAMLSALGPLVAYLFPKAIRVEIASGVRILGINLLVVGFLLLALKKLSK